MLALRFCGRLAEEIDHVASIFRRLREEREVSFCGDEETGAPAEELYTQQDSGEALRDARLVLALCQEFIGSPRSRWPSGNPLWCRYPLLPQGRGR